jgi:hypothetical protein
MLSYKLFIGLKHLVLLAGLSCLPLYAQAASNVSTLPELREAHFVHPGVLHNQAELDFIKQKVQAGEEPWFSGWKKLLDAEVSNMDWKTGAIADVLRGGYNRPDIGASDLERDAAAAYAQSIQWVVTGETRHALKAIAILNDWASRLKSIGEHDAKLLVGMTGVNMINGAEIIRHTSSLWKENDIAQFEKMLLDVHYEVIKDFFPAANGNWDASMIQTMECSISRRGRGRFRPIYERAYHHYHDRMGMEMPYTLEAIGKSRPEGWHIQHTSWGTLLYAGLTVSTQTTVNNKQ